MVWPPCDFGGALHARVGQHLSEDLGHLDQSCHAELDHFIATVLLWAPYSA